MQRWLVVTLLIASTAPLAREGLSAQRDTVPHSSRKSRVAAGDTGKVSVLETLIVTGSRVPIQLGRLGFAVSRLSSRDLEREGGPYAAHAFSRMPGVSLDQANGPGGPTIIRIRGGEEVYGKILVDGIEINQSGGYFDFQGVALSNLDGIELARGPHSSLYGSSAVSGVVQFLTRRGVAGPPRIGAEIEGSSSAGLGSGGRGSARVSGGGPAVRYSAGYGFTASRGQFALPNDLRTHDGSLRLDVTASDRVATYATLRYLGTESMLPVRDPGATRAPLDPNARNERTRLALGAGATIAAGGSWRHDVRVSAYRDAFIYSDRKDNVSSPDFFIFDATFLLDSRFRHLTAEYAVTKLLGSAGTAVVGARIEREELHDVTSGDFGDGNLELSRPARSLFGEGRYSFGSVVDVMAGARLESTRDIESELTPRAAVVVHLLPDRLSMRAAAGRAFKTPDLQQRYLDNPFIVANPNLRPETSTSWEIGARAQALSGQALLDVTYFDQRFDDLIRTVGVQGDTRQTNRNVGKSRSRGVEAELAYDPNGSWAVGGNATWLRTRIDDNTGLDPTQYPIGAPLPGRPKATASAWLEVEPTERVSLVARVGFVGSQTLFSERFSGTRERIDGHGLLALSTTVAIGRGLDIYGRVDNALDETYQTAFDRPGARRTVTLGIRR